MINSAWESGQLIEWNRCCIVIHARFLYMSGEEKSVSSYCFPLLDNSVEFSVQTKNSPDGFNTLRLRQNMRHVEGSIFKLIFLNENYWILIEYSQQFALNGPIKQYASIGSDNGLATSHYLNKCGLHIASWGIYRHTSNIRRTSVGNQIVDHSDVVGASPVGAAPTTSSSPT